jgi:uncharacterized protein (TIGR03790 family)
MRQAAATVAILGLLMLSPLPLPGQASNHQSNGPEALGLRSLFDGFAASTGEDVWNMTPWSDVAVPDGFDLLSVLDYSDVGVLINNNSDESRAIGWAFAAARNISSDRIFVFNGSDVPTSETINRQAFETHFDGPFRAMLANRSTSSDLNFLVTTKGIPLRISGGNDKASFDQELALIGGSYNASIGQNWWTTHAYGPLAGQPMERFSRAEHGFFLVTRLTGYTLDTALELIERANESLGSRGTYVLDLATNRNGSGYKFWNDDLYAANTSLREGHNASVLFDETSTFITNVSDVLGYASWGSNDGSWSQNFLPDYGFEAVDASTSSGRRSWEASAATPTASEAFGWVVDNTTTRTGQASMALQIAADCNASSGRNISGLLGEYYDNAAGVTIPNGGMPELIDRAPAYAQVEPNLDNSASYNAYAGLDDRFKVNWGARFSGLIDVPWSGNWTFYLDSDDGSELWVDGESIVQNHGMHGMRETSGWVNLSEGLHDLRVEFYQGNGPHGLRMSWSTSNLSKSIVPSSALSVAASWVPSANTLEHHWSFEDGSGSSATDAVGGADLALYGMNASNWRSCADGGCLWYDGDDDYAEVDVSDWDGNLTVSQWVWANASDLPDYASVFAVSNNAGANASFQHAAFNGEWRLHNNQTHAFGSIESQQWMHLVTVYDGGVVRQYLDGVLVNTHQQPAGAINGVERYRLGVNRAGTVHFEGMIDEVMVWSSALDAWEITALHRTVLTSCQPLSTGGADVARLQQTYAIGQDVRNHAWLGIAYGMSTNEAHGAFSVMYEGLDASGQVLSTNTSSPRSFTSAWATGVYRFRPDANATALRVTVLIDVGSTSTDGALHIDDVLLRAIRPSMGWLPGAIAETAVSTGGRSFTWGTSYGQSLVADLLEDGVSGVKGYVYEPYLTAVGRPSVLFDAYASGFGFAEANAMANLQIGWMGVVVGDPKMAPYADRLHDAVVVDARVTGNVTVGQPFNVDVLLENHGMSSAVGTLEVTELVGSDLLLRVPSNLSAGNVSGSRAVQQLSLTVNRSGWVDLQIRHVAAEGHPEADASDNIALLRFWVNTPPVVESLRCLTASAYRGDSVVCEVEASDDLGVIGVDLAWSIRNATGASTPWVTLPLGSGDGTTWWTSLVLPTDATIAPVGTLDLRATAVDESNASTESSSENVLQVLDAPGRWFGPHVAGVDPASWTGSTALLGTPPNGLSRSGTSLVQACVDDVDHDEVVDAPTLDVRTKANAAAPSVTIESLPNVTSSGTLHCSSWVLLLPTGYALDDLDLVVTSNEEERLRRRFHVADEAPRLAVSLVDAEGSNLSSAVGDGSERVRLHLTDADDPGAGAVGDLRLTWPGLATAVEPLQIGAGVGVLDVPLEVPMFALEDGVLSIEISLTGAHGASAGAMLDVPLRSVGPVIVESVLCDARGPVEELRFGEEVWLGAAIDSARPIVDRAAAIEQEGWRSIAPSWVPADTVAQPDPACAGTLPKESTMWFRLRPDGAFVNGQAIVSLRVTDLDGRWARSSVSLLLRHAPPTLGEPTINATGIAGEPVTIRVPVEDLDGILDVTCTLNVTAPDGGVVHNDAARVTAFDEQQGELVGSWLASSMANGTHLQRVECRDRDGGFAWLAANLSLAPANSTAVQDDNSTGRPDDDIQVDGMLSLLAPLGAGFLLLLVAAAVFLRRTQEEGFVDASGPLTVDPSLQEALWEDDAAEVPASMPALRRPEGWTKEQYRQWLDGPRPKGWSEGQWLKFVQEQRPLNDAS